MFDSLPNGSHFIDWRDAEDNVDGVIPMALLSHDDAEILAVVAPRSACRHKLEAVPTLEANKVIVVVSRTWLEGKLDKVRSDDAEAQEAMVAYIMGRVAQVGQEALALAGTEAL